MVNPLSNIFGKSHMVVAPVFRTKCGIDFFGYHAAGMNKNTFGVSGNSAHLPFYSALVQTNSYSINSASFTPYTGSVYSTMQPQGFTNICYSSALYLNYRVLGSKIKVRFIPLAISDTVVCTVNQVSTGEQWNTSVWTGAEAPYAGKTHTFTSSENNKSLIVKYSSAEAFGVPEIAIRDGQEFAGAFNTSPQNEWNWIINTQTVGTNTSSSVGIFLEIEYDIEFFNPITGGLNDVLKSRNLKNEVKAHDDGIASSVVLDDYERDYLVVGGKKYISKE